MSANDQAAGGRNGDTRPSNGRSKKGVVAGTDNTDIDGDDGGHSSKAYAECAAAAARAVKVVRHVEGAAAAAEREYAKRARDIVRLKAAVALREKRNDKSAGSGVVGVAERQVPPAAERDKGAGGGMGVGRNPLEGESLGRAGGDDGGGEEGAEGERGLVGCGGCAVLFEANERLLEEARIRGFINE